MAMICRAGPEAVNDMMDLVQILRSAPASWINNGGASAVLGRTEEYCYLQEVDFDVLHTGAKNLFVASALLMLTSGPLLACVTAAYVKFKVRDKMVSLQEANDILRDLQRVKADPLTEEKRKEEISDWRSRLEEQCQQIAEAEELLKDAEWDLSEARQAHERTVAEQKSREVLRQAEREESEKLRMEEHRRLRSIYFPGLAHVEHLRHLKELRERQEFHEQQLELMVQHFGGSKPAQAKGAAGGLGAVARKRGGGVARFTVPATNPPGAIAASRHSPASPAPLGRSLSARSAGSPRRASASSHKAPGSQAEDSSTRGSETAVIGKLLRARTRADAEKKSARQQQKHMNFQEAPVKVQHDVWSPEDMQRILDEKPDTAGLSAEQLANQLAYRPEHEVELLQPRARAKNRRSKRLSM